MRQIAITDIHGCALTFKTLLVDVINLSTDDELFLLGDFIDRGPSSKEVLDFILQLQADGYRVRGLRGNHEDMVLEMCENVNAHPRWYDHIAGGTQTLLSFGVKSVTQIPSPYLDFMWSLENYIDTGEYLLVHAGFNFLAPDPFSDTEAMYWIRDWYGHLRPEMLQGKIILHGHTPAWHTTIRQQLENLPLLPILCLDNGCFRNNKEGFGNLCAFDMTNRKLFFQKNLDDMSDYHASRP